MLNHIQNFEGFTKLLEKITPITSNWFIVDNESSFDKKEEGGYLVFNQKGIFSLIFYKKSLDEEARVNFYTSKIASPDKKSMCDVTILTRDGKSRALKSFDEINLDSCVEILSVFFDYCDLEKAEKDSCDRFLMGLAKAMKEVMKADNSQQLPSTYKALYNHLIQISKKSNQEIESKTSTNNMTLENLLLKFLGLFKKDL